MTPVPDHPLRLRVPPPVVTLLAAALVWTIARLLPALTWPFPLRRELAVVLACLGIAVTLTAVGKFRRANTTVNPLRPDATSQVVSDGIYRRTRNPMYVGLLLVLAAWTVDQANLAAVLVLPAFIAYLTRFQIQPEEEVLRRKFGASYQSYTEHVPRWL